MLFRVQRTRLIVLEFVARGDIGKDVDVRDIPGIKGVGVGNRDREWSSHAQQELSATIVYVPRAADISVGRLRGTVHDAASVA